MDREAAAALGCPDHWFRRWMPWAFARLGGEVEHVYLPLNRLRLPLGAAERARGRWRDHAAGAIIFRTDPNEFEGVWYEPPGAPADRPGRRRLILYDDAPESRMDYFARFERLMARASRLHGRGTWFGGEAPWGGSPPAEPAAAGVLTPP